MAAAATAVRTARTWTARSAAWGAAATGATATATPAERVLTVAANVSCCPSDFAVRSERMEDS